MRPGSAHGEAADGVGEQRDVCRQGASGDFAHQGVSMRA